MLAEQPSSLEIVTRLTTIETVVSRLEKELLGNGQPGRLDKAEARIADLEKRVWKIAGIVGVISAALGKALSGVDLSALLR